MEALGHCWSVRWSRGEGRMARHPRTSITQKSSGHKEDHKFFQGKFSFADKYPALNGNISRSFCLSRPRTAWRDWESQGSGCQHMIRLLPRPWASDRPPRSCVLSDFLASVTSLQPPTAIGVAIGVGQPSSCLCLGIETQELVTKQSWHRCLRDPREKSSPVSETRRQSR